MNIKILAIICIVIINTATVYGLSCDELLEIMPEQEVSKSILETMQPKDIVLCLAHLGKEKLPPSEAEIIWKSIIKFHEGIEHIPDSVLSTLHWITVAITPEEYANITLNDIDVIENFGLNYHLSEAQLSAIADRIREDFASKLPEDYTYYDLTALRQIICAFNKTEIERIPPSSYKEAAVMIGNLEQCSVEVLSGFATLAVQERAFGPLNHWTADTITIVGKVADYLPKEFLEKFNLHSVQKDLNT